MVKCLRDVSSEEMDKRWINVQRWIAFNRKKMLDFDYCEEYLRSVSNKILIMAAIRKANSHSVVIFRLIKKSIM